MKTSNTKKRGNPYYIVAPDYRENSAGTRVMHRLCHALNTQGFDAYIVGAETFNAQWDTPSLDNKKIIKHKRENKTPIAVYPEVVTGNPMNAPVCVRYILNKEGVIEGNPINAGEDDLFFYYSKAFTPNQNEKFDYLRINANDLDIFKPDPQQKKRGPLLYLNRIPQSSIDFAALPEDIEILSNKNPLSLVDLAKKLQAATVLYSYESSGTCTLAMLCGCPVVAMNLPGHEKLGFSRQTLSVYGGCGYSLTDSEEGLKAARDSLPILRRGVIKTEQAFWEELKVFAEKTQGKANEIASKKPVRLQGDELYQDWIATHRFQAADAREYESRIVQWAVPPHFHIAVVHDGGTERDLARTLQSLAGQYYTGVFVSVSSALSAPGGLNPERLEWLHGESCWESAELALQKARPDTWVGFVRAGDALAPHALLLLAEYLNSNPKLLAVYTDEDVIEADGVRHSPRFKPDFDLEWLRGRSYIGGLVLAKGEIWKTAGGWRHFADHQDEFDLALRLAEQLPAALFGHIPDVLYHRSAEHPAIKQRSPDNHPQIPYLHQHLSRCAPQALGAPGLIAGTSRVLYPLPSTPRVSLLIPVTDQLTHLQRCIESLFEQTDYPDFELIIIGHTGLESATHAFLGGLRQLGDSRINVLSDLPVTSTSALYNRGAEAATGVFLLLLDPAVAALHRDWLSEMVSLIQQPEVGAVGARLLQADGTLQHGGYLLGLDGATASPLAGHPADQTDALSRNHVTHQVRASSSACLLVRKDLYHAAGGLDAKRFPRDFADVDLCLKFGTLDQRVLWTPFATLLHSGADKSQTAANAADALHRRWMPELVRDSTSNPNFSLQDTELEPEPESALSWNPTPWNPLPRVLVHPVDQTGCGQYRILNPARALHDAGHCRGHASQRFFNPVEIAKANMASIVVQLPISARHLKALEIYRQHSSAFRIVEVDDLITDIPRASPHFHTTGKGARDYFRPSLNLADRLIVTTEPLAAAYAGLCREIRVARNYLPGNLWTHLTPKRRHTGKPRVGWAGSTSHLGDLALLGEIVKALAKEVDWVFFGACPQDLLPYVKEFLVGIPFDQYPSTLASLGLDLAIAPLENNAFNECKSPLKLLEYGILGYPVVCSNSGAYRGDFPVTRLPNTAKAWIAAIRERIHDLDATQREGEVLQAHIRQHWMLEDHLDEWLAAWIR